MTTQTFDPVKYKETTRQQWQNAAEAWHRWTPLLQAWLGEATDVMLDLARISPGMRVLDVAAGAGEPAVTIAKRVGPTGYVLASDISSEYSGVRAEGRRRAGADQRRDKDAGR